MNDLFLRLVQRNERRSEAEIQADVRQFILSAPFELDEGDVRVVNLETSVGDRRRIDVEVGSTVIEIKRDLRRQRIKQEAVLQLADYVRGRTNETGLRYIGVLTDGTEWVAYNLVGQLLSEVSSSTFGQTPDELSRLIAWLEGVLATAHHIAPTIENITARLGAASSAYALDRATIASLYASNQSNPSVVMKRTLWSRLLRSALGTQFEDSEDLFIEHTLLVNTAEIIAHAILGIPPETVTPATLLGGGKFDESGIFGVVEPDFFDWIVEVEGGSTFVRTLARRLSRFDWSAVDQDVLKVLYESVIGAETRKRLGEYYTPDWLANAVVARTVTDPLNSRALDPACGSGTFLFHAIRAYIAAAREAGSGVAEMLDGVTRSVIGMDLHPVAVTLARVTYLLAIGRQLLTDPDRGTLQIPVYLGDSLQWEEQSRDLWAAGNLVIQVDDKRELFGADLRFPDQLLDDASRFDQLITEMANRASRRKPGAPIPSLRSVFQRLAIEPAYIDTLEATFALMCRLHDEGRDHIWGYYVRNLARPLWMSRERNRVDMLIGNPPWLAYRHMTPEMQVSFKRMSERRGLWAGAENATHQDLSALFTVRMAELYLRHNGRFAFVLPNAALDRAQYAGFRSGTYGDASIAMGLTFEEPWDLRRIRPHFFPRAASVVFGSRTTAGSAMGERALIWSGRVARTNANWAAVEATLERVEGRLRRSGEIDRSPYAPTFSQGATFVPRLAFAVECQEASPLGLPAGRMAIRSSRSVQEPKPWKTLPSLNGVVESEFVRPYYTGENVFPYRLGPALLCVMPVDRTHMLAPNEIELHPGLQSWWEEAEELWTANRASERLTLRQRIDYQRSLSKQLPVAGSRVVYNRAGMHVVAAKVADRRALIASGLYWARVRSEREADYLCAIMNSPATTELVRPLMSYGKDERDIHKHIWELPIPLFDPDNHQHALLADLGALCERHVAALPLAAGIHFSAVRRAVRQELAKFQPACDIDELVYELIG